jgi:colicin import membrane protein
LRKSSGNPAYDAAVERAIGNASPLPVPDDSDLFQESFRELDLVFRPKD